MAEKKKTGKNKLKTIAGVGGGLLLLGGIGYVINEVRKEYDSTVEENNYLRGFINDHDFYKKEERPKMSSLPKFNGSASTDKKVEKFNFVPKKKAPTLSYDRGDGTTVNEYTDSKTGLTVIEVVDTPVDAEDEKATNA